MGLANHLGANATSMEDITMLTLLYYLPLLIPSFSSALLLFLTSLRDIRITSVHQALQGQECLYCLKP